MAELPDPDADTYILDDNECTQVTLVGQIRNISHQSTNVTCKVDDGTGTIEVKIWNDPNANGNGMGGDEGAGQESGMVGRLKEGIYVRCWGKIKHFGRRHVVAHVIRPIEDMNEVNYHLLECTAVHLQLSKGGPTGDKTGEKSMSGGGNAADMDVVRNMSSTARKVFEYMKGSPETNEGLHVQAIALALKIDVAEVYKGGEELQAHGLIYPTVDDSTWAVMHV